MKLDEFIQKTLMQILKGVRDAQIESNKQGPGTGVINPKWGTALDHADYESEVAFDIAVTASDQKSGGGQAGLKVLGADIGSKGEMKAERSSISRVAFSLKVALPSVIVKDVPPRKAK